MAEFGVYLVKQNTGTVLPLASDKENIIGRGIHPQDNPQALVLLPQPAVSKRHARIYLDAASSRWYFEDFSRHGSQVNGKAVGSNKLGIPGKVMLRHGDEIAIGPERLLFYEKFMAQDGTAETAIPGDRIVENEETTPMLETIAIAIVLAVAALILLWCM